MTVSVIAIKPTKRTGDKYNERLYRRLTLSPNQQMFISTHYVDGYTQPLDVTTIPYRGSLERYVLMLGTMENDRAYFAGNRLSGITSGHVPVRESFAYSSQFDVANWIDVTEWFNAEYEKHGMCAFSSWAHDWIVINANSRKCSYCGEHQTRAIKTHRIIQRDEIWTPTERLVLP